MKKLLALLFIGLMATPAFALDMFDYKNTRPINDANSIKTKGCNEYVKMESKFNSSLFDGRDVAGALSAGAIAGGALVALVMDPYVVTIDGVRYVLVTDRNDKNWSPDDILGINDPKNNRFASLIALNSDGDHSKISAAELKKANIRFVRMDKNGVLLVNDRKKDFDLNKIDYIDIINLKRTANSQHTGIFGHFTMYLKTPDVKKRAVVGYVTYETKETINVLFK